MAENHKSRETPGKKKKPMTTENKKPGSEPGDAFWKAVALIGTLASLAGLVISLLK